MANLEVNVSSTVCRKCGRAYGRLKGYFPISYGELYKGTGYLPYCWECVNKMYTGYLTECGSEARATEQLCRKLDIYWNEDLYRMAEKRTNARSVLTNYLSRLTGAQYTGKSYDDTLREEKRMWGKAGAEASSAPAAAEADDVEVPASFDREPITITDKIVAFWGPGYTEEMYQELEQRLRYYKERMNGGEQVDMETEALLRQIAMAEIDINKARASGMPVDKMVNSLNSLLSSLKKPQKRDGNDAASNTPFGVWIKRWEDERPVPEIDESLKDVDGIVKYILTWVYGHVAHMMKLKNANTKLYDDEIARLRVERPEYNDEDDEGILNDLYGIGGEDEDTQ